MSVSTISFQIQRRLTRELQLFARHSLQGHGKVERRDRDLGDFLEGHDEAFLRDSDLIDSYTGDGEVRVRLGNVIPHCVCIWSVVCMGLLVESVDKFREFVG